MTRTKLLSTIVEMWRESSLIQGILTLVIVFVWLGLMIAGNPVPEQLNGVTLLVVGYYFGTKSSQQAKALVSSYIAAAEKDC